MSRVTEYPPLWGDPDRPGSREPRGFNPLTWMKHPATRRVFAAFDRDVPPGFWSEDVEAERTVAIISCPCGEETHVALASTVFCEGCDRVFWHLGDKIKVARNPAPAEAGAPEGG